MRSYSIPYTETIVAKSLAVEMDLVLGEQGPPVRSPHAILMAQAVQLSVWHSGHSMALLDQLLQAVVHQ